ncbi:MAG: hypothetical protein QXM25_04245 [Nitrososphaerales archaeon]
MLIKTDKNLQPDENLNNLEMQEKDVRVDSMHICLYLIMHQPIRLNKAFPYERVKRMTEGASLMDRYFDDKLNQEVFERLFKKYYNPTLNYLMEMIISTEKSDKPFNG